MIVEVEIIAKRLVLTDILDYYWIFSWVSLEICLSQLKQKYQRNTRKRATCRKLRQKVLIAWLHLAASRGASGYYAAELLRYVNHVLPRLRGMSNVTSALNGPITALILSQVNFTLRSNNSKLWAHRGWRLFFLAI